MISALSGIVVVILSFFVFRGYWPLIRVFGGDWRDYTIRGVLLVWTAFVIRVAVWDVTRAFLNLHQWISFRDTVGTEINLLINGMFCVACYQFMMSRYLLIPDDERDQYSWMTAWASGSKRCFLNVWGPEDEEN